MARIGLKQWEVMKRTDIPNYLETVEQVAYREMHYAMRADGKLLKRYVVGFVDHFTDNIKRHDYGWKIASKRPRKDCLEYLESLGYSKR